ncbi:MAG: hypothetical protein HY902_01280 [Deltaproteobacteria bacterium]|nr:hypothetical protein [Deltaproteobacteria bacterium]
MTTAAAIGSATGPTLRRLSPEQRRTFLDQIVDRCAERSGPGAGSFVLHSDGLLVAGHAPGGIDSELAAAHCAMVWEQSLRLARDGMAGSLDTLGMTLTGHQVWLRQVRGELLFALWLPPVANLGAALLAAEQAVADLQVWLGPDAQRRRRAAAKVGAWKH